MDKLSTEREAAPGPWKLNNIKTWTEPFLVLEKDLKQFQTQVIEGRIAYAYLRWNID